MRAGRNFFEIRVNIPAGSPRAPRFAPIRSGETWPAPPAKRTARETIRHGFFHPL
jgi:hypothetical protein